MRTEIQTNVKEQSFVSHSGIFEKIQRLDSLLFRLMGKKMKTSLVFSAPTEATQKDLFAIEAGLEAQIQFLEMALQEEVDGCDERQMLNLAMKKLGLMSLHSATNLVESTDVVEILDENFCQVYRSFSCFALSNYSISELVSIPWYELYDRPSRVEEKLHWVGGKFLSGSDNYIDLTGEIPSYVLREKLSEEKASFLVQERFVVRLKSSLNGKNYFLTVKKIQPSSDETDDKIQFI